MCLKQLQGTWELTEKAWSIQENEVYKERVNRENIVSRETETNKNILQRKAP